MGASSSTADGEEAGVPKDTEGSQNAFNAQDAQTGERHGTQGQTQEDESRTKPMESPADDAKVPEAPMPAAPVSDSTEVLPQVSTLSAPSATVLTEPVTPATPEAPAAPVAPVAPVLPAAEQIPPLQPASPAAVPAVTTAPATSSAPLATHASVSAVTPVGLVAPAAPVAPLSPGAMAGLPAAMPQQVVSPVASVQPAGHVEASVPGLLSVPVPMPVATAGHVAAPKAPAAAGPVLSTSVAVSAEDASEAWGEHEAAPAAQEGGKPRTLEQMMSLKPGDDERTEISKKISWILRHGAKKVNVSIDENGWVNVNDLVNSDILGGTTEDKLLAMINESNVQKTRYEMEDDPQGGKRIRAISKSRRNAAARAERERERRERRQDLGPPELLPGQGEIRDNQLRERIGSGDLRDTLRDPLRDPLREPLGEPLQNSHREPQRRRDSAWWEGRERGWQDDGPTFEQQIAQGFLPVYQGDRLVAMARGDETVRPGRRTQPPYREKGFDGKGFDGKGFHGMGFDGKGFDGRGFKGFDAKGFDGKGFDGRFDGKGYSDMLKGDMKGDRKGKGKDDFKGKGKFGDDGKGFYLGKGDGYRGDGYKGDGYKGDGYRIDGHRGADMDGDGDDRNEGKGAYSRPGARQNRWRAVNGQDIIVRVGLGMETDVVGTLLAGSLVAQVGEDKIVKNGIARMFIESIEPQQGIKGWVTRSAEAAGGPVFFKPERSPPVREQRKGDGKSSVKGGEKGDKGGGKNLDAKGKGRRPIGEGEAGWSLHIS
eukprot:TRINITY_DN4447_c0_g1_i2.p1 TRINITY_DN4447_c0_g1~~TRINITY_DN4447_c0_g1_i2.p1  ORF type:complete len:767 (+),score=139.08 TRINITY_DN4447_c0_g1_i2:97-2397(+)